MKVFYSLAALLFFTTTALAHSWYSEKRDPLYPAQHLMEDYHVG